MPPVRPEVYLVAVVPLIRPRENELRTFKSLSKTNNLNEIISKQLTNPNYASDQKTGKPRKLSRLPQSKDKTFKALGLAENTATQGSVSSTDRTGPCSAIV